MSEKLGMRSEEFKLPFKSVKTKAPLPKNIHYFTTN